MSASPDSYNFYTQNNEVNMWDAVRQATGRVMMVGAIVGGALVPTEGAQEVDPVSYVTKSPSCYGDYCSGQYARDTGCDKDATTLDTVTATGWEEKTNGADLTVDRIEVKLGKLELRYSEECGTKWARLRTIRDSDIDVVGVAKDDGYSQERRIEGWAPGSPAAVSQSPMIYSPDDVVHAYVGGANLKDLSTEWE